MREPEPTPTRQVRGDWRTAGALSLCFLCFYLIFHHGSFAGSDEIGVYYTTQSLYERGDLVVPPIRHAWKGSDGRTYSQYAIGQSLLALPLYAAAELAEAALPEKWAIALAGPRRASVTAAEQLVAAGEIGIFFVGLYGPLSSALLVGLFYLLERQLGASKRASLAAAALLGACSYAATMSVYFLRHTSETLMLLGAIYGFDRYRETGSTRTLALGSLSASLIVLVRVGGVLAAPGLALYLAACLRQRWRGGSARVARALPAVAFPFALVAAVHFAVNQLKWGGWLEGPMFREAQLRIPMGEGLAGFLLSPGASVFVYWPPLLLLPWSLGALWRRSPPLLLSIALSTGCYLFFYAGFIQWTGLWSAPGPRYLFPVCVLLMLPVGLWLDRRPGIPARIALSGLAAAGFATQLGLMAASWSATIRLADYASYRPPYSFLWLPEASPVITCLQSVVAGYHDVWLLKLAVGWPGMPGQPRAALAILLAILIALAGSLVWLARTLRDARTTD